MAIEREKIDFDVLFVGGGPASLAGAIRLMQLSQENDLNLEVAVIEKGAEIGSHAISGAILNPIALRELLPDFQEQGCPISGTVRNDEFHYLTKSGAFKMPIVPRYLHNKGFFIISLSRFVRWLGATAEEMGVNIFPGFTGKELLLGEDQKTITGIRTGDQGLGPDGEPKANFEPGIDIQAKVTVLGEGARGSLFKNLDEKLGLSDGKMPQIYETGIKEVIQLPEDNYFKSSKGNDIHTLGYPLGLETAGGGFIYEMEDNKISIGYLVALGYEDRELDPYEEFTKFKTHPFVKKIINGGKVLEQGARTVSTGGFYTVPRLAGDGVMVVGGSAGIQNTPGLKGIHVSMKSGMLAAEAIVEAMQKQKFDAESLASYQQRFNNSWVKTEMYAGRNFAQAVAIKGLMKFVHLGAQYISNGRGLIDQMTIEADYKTLKDSNGSNAGVRRELDKHVYDNTLVLDKLTGVYMSKTKHREDEPCHLIVHDTDLCINTCYPKYQSPCTRFCPANVYEIETDETTSSRRLKVNFTNCLHCKTCDIKDPYENITWTCPEGAEGPGYSMV